MPAGWSPVALEIMSHPRYLPVSSDDRSAVNAPRKTAFRDLECRPREVTRDQV